MVYRKKTITLCLLSASALSLYAITQLEKINAPRYEQSQIYLERRLASSSTCPQEYQQHFDTVPDIINGLINGTLTGNNIDPEAWDDIRTYVLEKNLLKPKKHAAFLHAINTLYQKTNMAQEKKANNNTLYGNEPASLKTTAMIHETLKKQNCAIVDVSIYKLAPGKNGAHTKGFTTSCGIWIDESAFLDDEELEYACKHEAGHWYYMHPIEHFFSKHAPLERQEFEADEFALANMSASSKKTLIARAQQKLNPIEDYLEHPELVAILKPHTIQRGSFEIQKLNLPNKEHATNIVKIASRS